ncbi:alpha/beta-hydrolase [Patellaria atrata CBS 101060]|uniref:Carboxylic ester hydrolase n=1 Tax=Patellaria atrata CBS 101060 TaxID=1346257 RepID=A0A9P4S322_9PEZI|nr:alpha/beta-hydrolase [Patellaria atrata CBS 101060]
MARLTKALYATLYLASLVTALPGSSTRHASKPPTVKVKNGTYVGVYSAPYEQDFFLGIPYAQPPVGNLRFRTPKSLDERWSGSRNATSYSRECVGYGSDQWNYETSEDCLYLNVVRPAGHKGKKLPVAFWIHGGGYYQGGAPDQRYNLSFAVQTAAEIGKPIIGVSINYRLSVWGFLASQQTLAAGATNLGLRDQRLALHWVQENIAAFGGDPKKVTIFGESAGGDSVGMHLTAYGGRDDKLFQGAIMQSGNPVRYTALNQTSDFQSLYDLIAFQTGCIQTPDSLQCLRDLPFARLNAVINSTALPFLINAWAPHIDNDFIRGLTSLQLARGEFVHVPIITGANSDEGSAFGVKGINTDEEFFNVLITSSPRETNISPEFARQIMAAYPDDPSVFILQNLPPTFHPGPPQGSQFRRVGAYYGDQIFIANSRLTAQTWAAAGVPAYRYRFNAIPADIPELVGVTHFQEVAFVFNNILGVGYSPAATPPFRGKGQNYKDLARLMCGSWMSFVHELDPNAWRGRRDRGERWPRYNNRRPMDFVFDANRTSYAEPDTYRKRGMELINENNVEEYHR